jgi:NAD(P)-dependent dehydrogenase (short-subunit alcohol dehydrogenase family)
MNRLTNKSALITGGSSGIGLKSAREDIDGLAALRINACGALIRVRRTYH